MKLLYIAPLPPPVTGHSIAAKVLFDYLRSNHHVALVDLSIASEHDGSVTYRRTLEVIKALLQVLRKIPKADAIYLTISESVAGNIKDLLIYLICANRLNNFYIHLHGGSIKKLLFDVHPVLRWLNSIAIRRMAGVIISGRSHTDIFAPLIDNSRIHIIPNFAQDHLFVAEKMIEEKFSDRSVLHLLYISGMTLGKGYLRLLEAYESLSEEDKQMVRIDFAGKFDIEGECAEFIERIAGQAGLAYHGLVDEVTKRSLFAKAHIFCLPTSFLEGQPISILEAYASGCAVMTTGQNGIHDIFCDGINGFEIQHHAPASIALTIQRILSLSMNLTGIAKHNWRTAMTQYRTSIFTKRVTEILVSGTPSIAKFTRI